jgi:hypothetical protein
MVTRRLAEGKSLMRTAFRRPCLPWASCQKEAAFESRNASDPAYDAYVDNFINSAPTADRGIDRGAFGTVVFGLGDATLVELDDGRDRQSPSLASR